MVATVAAQNLNLDSWLVTGLEDNGGLLVWATRKDDRWWFNSGTMVKQWGFGSKMKKDDREGLTTVQTIVARNGVAMKNDRSSEGWERMA